MAYFIRFNYNKGRRKVYMISEQRPEFGKKRLQRITLGKKLAYILGFKDSTMQLKQPWLKLPAEKREEGGAVRTLAEHAPDMTGALHTIYVYSDIVQPVIVSDIRAPLLTTAPVQGERERERHGRNKPSPFINDVIVHFRRTRRQVGSRL